ncbi:DUF1802 family protein [Nostoc sp. FACHB-152]|uniref:DUF1802 family protein n=1 Tax=unclassified Nostoc TaxID=2593658 RepID=UPI0016899E81|nr:MULTISPECIES: DUF1802 family protein [unclassified Nostoc]MBD2447909.1 DUF1802 family protein [Nostoc sp. FACHB-152]MBD2468517.1 DUF1802 family protein [Nostoc sp. FACHB-145]
MSELIYLNTALSLDYPDIEALIQGRMIAFIPWTFINPGRSFALCTSTTVNNLFIEEQSYKPDLSKIDHKTQKISSGRALIKAWAKCELCQIIDKAESLNTLSQLTIWTKQALQQAFQQRQYIFLAYIRVYLLSSPIQISLYKQSQFIGLPAPVKVTNTNPVLSDRTFAQRKQQLEKLEPPQHIELQELQSLLAPLAITSQAAKQLDEDIKFFLGWSSNQFQNTLDADLTWIQKIAEVGNSSDGHQFEKLVRRGLLKLGFTGSGLNPDATGGAGGMDFYAEKPFAMVGECKATKTEKVTDGTPAQLLKIGMNHLGAFQYNNSIKLIVAAGELNSYALRTATENHMNVISPETLQKLVELQTYYKNSINLLELKVCLQQAPFGLAEEKVNSYIDKVEQSIKLRSHLINLVKSYLHNSGTESAGVEALHGAYFGSNLPRPIRTEEMHEILIELSSPLTGYLGREKGTDWKSDRFYFLRNLEIYSR